MFAAPLKRGALLLCLLLLTGCAGGAAPTPAPQTPATAKPAAKVDYSGVYPALWKVSDEGPAIPGLGDGVIPQGLAYWKDKNWLIMSGYVESGGASTLAIMDAGTQALVKTVQLYQENGSAYGGHAGGVAVSQRHLWISSGGLLWWAPLSALADAPDKGKLTFSGRFETVVRSSFTTYHGGILWAGEFYSAPDYETDDSHKLSRNGLRYSAWTVGYRLDAQTDLPKAEAQPDYVLAIPDQVQGMAVASGNMILSQSYGRNKQSTLLKYKLPDLTGQPDQSVSVKGKSVPLWFMERKLVTASLPLPPMSEGIIVDGANRLYILFESGAKKYRPSAVDPMDQFRVIRLADWNP